MEKEDACDDARGRAAREARDTCPVGVASYQAQVTSCDEDLSVEKK